MYTPIHHHKTKGKKMLVAQMGNGVFEGVSRKNLAKQIAEFYVENESGEPWIDGLFLIRDEEYAIPDATLFKFRELVEETYNDKLSNSGDWEAYVQEQQLCARAQ